MSGHYLNLFLIVVGGLNSIVPNEEIEIFKQKLKSRRHLTRFLLVLIVVGGIVLNREWIDGSVFLFLLLSACSLILIWFSISFLNGRNKAEACGIIAGPNYLLQDYYRSSLIRLSPWFIVVFGSLFAFIRIVAGEWHWMILIPGGPLAFVVGQSFFRCRLRIGHEGIFDGRDFYPWDRVSWYRHYEHREALLVGVGGSSRFQPYLVIPLSKDSQLELEILLEECAPGKELEEVETALSAVIAEKEIERKHYAQTYAQNSR